MRPSRHAAAARSHGCKCKTTNCSYQPDVCRHPKRSSCWSRRLTGASESDRDGQNSNAYPALSCVPGDLFGICVVGVDGKVFGTGDFEHEFSIMSVSKPFVFALVCQAAGADELRDKIGANATGQPFNSLSAVESSPTGRTNPMVNAGAIATTSLVPGATIEARWRFIYDGMCRFAGRALSLNEEVYDPRPQPTSAIGASRGSLKLGTASTAIRSKRPTSTPGSAPSTSTPRIWR